MTATPRSTVRLVFLGYDEASDRCVRVLHFVEGKRDTVYRLRVVADRRVDAGDFARAYELCNKWNASYRWPRAFLEIPVPPEGAGAPGSGILAMDFQIQLEKGIHQALFDDMVGTAVGTTTSGKWPGKTTTCERSPRFLYPMSHWHPASKEIR